MYDYIVTAIIMGGLVGLYFALQSRYKAQVSRVLLYLVLEAESTFGKGTGELKFAYVSELVYSKLPTFARLMLSPNTIDNMIEDAVEYMKIYLASNLDAVKDAMIIDYPV